MNKMRTKIEHWIKTINEETGCPTDVIALNFGLFESVNGYGIYLIGSKSYDENDDDWACDIDFEPQNKYLMLTHDNVQNMDWKEIQHEVTNIISKYISDKRNNISLFQNKIITIGFDDGNLEKIK